MPWDWGKAPKNIGVKIGRAPKNIGEIIGRNQKNEGGAEKRQFFHRWQELVKKLKNWIKYLIIKRRTLGEKEKKINNFND